MEKNFKKFQKFFNNNNDNNNNNNKNKKKTNILKLTKRYIKKIDISLSGVPFPIAGGRIIEPIPFLRTIVPYEMQTNSSRNWTWVSLEGARPKWEHILPCELEEPRVNYTLELGPFRQGGQMIFGQQYII